MILLDEMYSGLKEYLEVMGWEVETIKDAGLTGAEDKTVAEFAKNNDLLLVTEDSKPAELSDLLGARYYLLEMKTKARMIEEQILEKYPDLRDEREG
ncbi:MAG: DUF5615 family PIN-like protein [Candidatus Bathyarchaeia archaeon]